MTDPEDQNSAAFRAEVARAFRGISGGMEVLEATRALIDVLHERELLQLADVRERALAPERGAELAPHTIYALAQLLDENGLSAPKVLQ